MESLTESSIADGSLLFLDSAPIIYVLEGHRRLASRFLPIFERHASGAIGLAVSAITLAEVLTGPLKAHDEILAKRYRSTLESWHVVDFTPEIAESAARFRATAGLRLPDAVQVASAVAIGADALVTHDRDFSRVRALPVYS